MVENRLRIGVTIETGNPRLDFIADGVVGGQFMLMMMMTMTTTMYWFCELGGGRGGRARDGFVFDGGGGGELFVRTYGLGQSGQPRLEPHAIVDEPVLGDEALRRRQVPGVLEFRPH